MRLSETHLNRNWATGFFGKSLMGFDDLFKIVVSDTQAYKQFGNSVVVPVIKAVAKVMKPYIINQAITEGEPEARAEAV